MSSITFDSKVSAINDTLLLAVPRDSGNTLPSRGLVMVEGTINGQPFKEALEPDGKGSHWLRVTEAMQKKMQLTVGDSVEIELEPTSDWPEPVTPEDLLAALNADATAKALWDEVTPMARWDWIRWVRSTQNPATRQRRVEVAMSKLNKGTRRPCCFNRSECTDPAVSKGGVLLATS